ncbi:GntR family transcriptional repressor for pyruvate dehydrogenase complex [Kineosphaera limosa]|uniref:Putative GntR family transcriptional regulator n=1 Tax=Kineosphaera limosa NBRC 100340 TaxID=1184609 RepID=K6VMZ0_9MICO|nr:FadR/GntR family transcriptional regulator [Kineosphaera limosa]NYE01172.1 GntR family transcriptional repressor for pyruvate dehydrogenase complex [Kineosphaera limosa]GAB97593.1 putative GntR family transcriptional regulator [Kineosphaera limosa NBRC 100340]
MALTDVAIERIKQMIIDGQLSPGDRLPPERELGERLGLSRNSLREAVKALEVMRVLDVRRGDGTYVTSLEPDLLLDVMSFVVDLQHDSTVLELLEVRAILEPQAAAMAAQHVTDADIDELRSLVAAARHASTIEELVANDMEFHGRINAIAGNQYLASVLRTLSTGTQRARIWRGLTQTGAGERTIAEHGAIVDALAQRNGELARAHEIIHVNGVIAWLRSTLDSTTSPVRARRRRPAPAPRP